MFIESVMPPNHLILCCPLLLPLSIFPSIRVISKESVLHISWPKYWTFSFSISPSNEHSGLIFFRTDLLDLLAAQGTLKSLLQHHSSKSSIFRCSAFFIVQVNFSFLDKYLLNAYYLSFTGLRTVHTNLNRSEKVPLWRSWCAREADKKWISKQINN